jgi:hypothetical protein
LAACWNEGSARAAERWHWARAAELNCFSIKRQEIGDDCYSVDVQSKQIWLQT